MKEKLYKELVKELYRDNKFYLLGALAVAFGTAAINVALSWLLQMAIDIATGEASMTFMQVLYLALAFILLTVVIMALNAYFFPRYIKRAMVNYKQYLLQKLLRKNIADFSRLGKSVYLSALTNDTKVIEEKYVRQQLTLITEIVTFIGALAFMLYLSVLMTLVSIAITMIPVISSLITGSRLVKIEQVISEKNSTFVGIISDFINGFPLVKNFKAEKQIAKHLGQSNENLEENKKQLENSRLTISLFSQGSGIFTQLAVTMFGAYLVLNDQGFTAGMIISFVNLMNFIISPVVNLPTMISERRAALGLIKKAASFLDPGEADPDQQMTPLPSLEESIKLQSVSFAYPGGDTILKDLDWEFKRGKSYAIVGASGSGKSTLLKLLMKNQQPVSGNIYYDQINLKDAKLDALYEEVSLIDQDVFVFNASILDNLTMFQDFDEDQIQEVIDQASLRKLVNDKGLSYSCGENGVNLSGGEKQRIAIGRALLKNSSIFLTDEATSALDKETAYQITNDILNLSEKTKIMITHSLAKGLLEQYDEILVLKNGNIAESGSFADLVEANGYFNYLYSIA